MKTIQKIAAILYSIWALFRGYVLVVTVLYSSSNIVVTPHGVKNSFNLNNINIFSILLFFTSLSLIASSIFMIVNAFLKKDSFKRNVVSIVWLGINTTAIFLIPSMSYLVNELIAITTLFNAYADGPKFTIATILSSNVLIAIALLNILIIALKMGGIGREKA